MYCIAQRSPDFSEGCRLVSRASFPQRCCSSSLKVGPLSYSVLYRGRPLLTAFSRSPGATALSPKHVLYACKHTRHTHTHIHSDQHARTHTRARAHTHTHTRSHIHSDKHARTHARTHTRTHKHTLINVNMHRHFSCPRGFQKAELCSFIVERMEPQSSVKTSKLQPSDPAAAYPCTCVHRHAHMHTHNHTSQESFSVGNMCCSLRRMF